MFTDKSAPKPAEPVAVVGEIPADFQPQKGSFLRTLEFPQVDSHSQPTGKIWMEAGKDPKTGNWVLWQKGIREENDVLAGGTAGVITSTMVDEKTTFAAAYDRMTTFEEAQKALGLIPLPGLTQAKLGGDYFRQFAWREGLMMSRSGRLYPVTDDKINAANFFDEKDITDATAFLTRLREEKFVPVPFQLPTSDWKKAYAARKELTDQRLNLLYSRYNNDKNNPELNLQIVGQEVPEVLYAHLQNGFNPKTLQADPAQHFAMVKAAIDRDSVDSLNLLSEAGVSFYVTQGGQTPVDVALQQRHYSHLYVMLSRDGAALANYADGEGLSPAVKAIKLQDTQALRMLNQAGIDFKPVDAEGWSVVHHAFDQNFIPGIYTWTDEGLSIDAPIKDTAYTGVSIAKRNNNQPLVDFAVKHGANAAAPALADAAGSKTGAPGAAAAPALPFSVALLNTAATNDEIERSAKTHLAAGGDLNLLDPKGVSLLELSWKNQKPKPELDRRALLPVFAGLGADSSALLPDGTTVLTRAVGGASLDLQFLKAVAPLAKNENSGDAKGNTVMHALELNNSEQVGLSAQVDAVLKLFPNLDLNLQNKAGLSSIGLAIRLDKFQTLKSFPSDTQVDWKQTTAAGWSYLDLAFTKACAKEKIPGCQRADRVAAVSEKTRGLVLDMLEGAPAGQHDMIGGMIGRNRPDDETLLSTMAAEGAPEPTMDRLKELDVLKPAVRPKLPSPPT